MTKFAIVLDIKYIFSVYGFMFYFFKKIMYRIKKEIDGYTLEARYIPEYRFFGFWFHFLEFEMAGASFYVMFDTEKEAREFIKKQRSKKCTSTRYIYDV